MYKYLRVVTVISRIGKIIKEYRKTNNLTQFQLAERIEVSEFYISALETGARNPGRKALVKLASEMNVPIDSLLDIETDYSLRYASDDIYKRIEALPEEKRALAVDLIYSIIETLSKDKTDRN